MCAERRHLPPRRLVLRERITYRHDRGHELKLYVTAGFHPYTFELLEVFVRPRGNVDSDLCRLMDDVGVLISRCVQFGDQLHTLADGMGRLPGAPRDGGGRAAHSPIGAIVDILMLMRSEVSRTWPRPLNTSVTAP